MMKKKIDKMVEVIPKKGKKKFKRFSSGKINISFEGKPPFLVKESEFKYISDWFEIKEKDKKKENGGK